MSLLFSCPSHSHGLAALCTEGHLPRYRQRLSLMLERARIHVCTTLLVALVSSGARRTQYSLLKAYKHRKVAHYECVPVPCSFLPTLNTFVPFNY
jgi:hypothetical protein